MSAAVSALQKARAAYQPKLPKSLRNGAAAKAVNGEPTTAAGNVEQIKALFTENFGSPMVTFEAAAADAVNSKFNAGVILSGGQAPGGHNVIAGIYDGLKSLNKENKLYGFLKGPDGLVKNEYIELTDEIIDAHRNTGGFDMIGSGRTKLEKVEQFEAGKKNCEALNIKALVIVGGDPTKSFPGEIIRPQRWVFFIEMVFKFM